MGAPVDTGSAVDMGALVGMRARGLCGHELMDTDVSTGAVGMGTAADGVRGGLP